MHSNIFEQNPKKTIIFTLLFSILGIVLVTESVLPDTVKADPRMVRNIRLKEHQPGIVRYVRPSNHYLSMTENLEGKIVKLEIDADGYIMPSRTHHDADKTIIFYGGSTTECLYIPEKQRFPYLTSILLSNDSTKVNTINAGVSGNHSMHSINAFLNKGLSHGPDIAVLLHNINDLSTIVYEGGYWNENPTRSLIQNAEKFNLVDYLKQKTQNTIPKLYSRLAEFKKAYFAAAGLQDEFSHLKGSTIEVNQQKTLRLFENNLRMFIAITRINGVEPVLMTQANRFTEEPDSLMLSKWRGQNDFGIPYNLYIALYKKMNQRIQQVGTSENVLVIDLASDVPQTSKFMYDEVHFTEFGSAFVANYIATKLENFTQINLLQANNRK